MVTQPSDVEALVLLASLDWLERDGRPSPYALRILAAHAAQARKEGAQEVLAKLRDLPLGPELEAVARKTGQPALTIATIASALADALEGELS